MIPSGTDIILHIHQLHRSAQYFENPNEFNPSNFSSEKIHQRNPFAYIPFSGGPRNCIGKNSIKILKILYLEIPIFYSVILCRAGQRFAMIEMKIVLSSIFRKFRVTSIKKKDEISIISDTVLRPENGVWIKLEKRA